MTTRQIASALEEWAVRITTGHANPDIEPLSSYDYPPEDLNEAMPLVIAEVKSTRRASRNAPQEEGFQQRQYQQIALKIWSVDLMILVDPEPSWTASYKLYDYVDALGAALKRDPVLAGAVEFASKDYSASFDPPEVEYSDGTIARAATLTVSIGQQEEV